MSLVVKVADAIATALQAEPLELDAVRTYRPEFDLAELKTLRVSVVPRGIEITSAGRQANQHDVSVDVAMQKKVDLADTAGIDALMLLVEQVADFLRLRRLELAGGSAIWVKTENTPIYSPEHLETKHVFTSVLTFTFRVVR